MRILVVNDDGIRAPGIERLARAAKEFGEVTVVAPDTQCSGMSARITIFDKLTVKKEEFPVEGVAAYSVSGTPVDCVKVAVEYLMSDSRPDIVFSGINRGYNAGIEISYSGTVGAAMEALMKGIPAMAFSVDASEEYGIVDAYLHDVISDLLAKEISEGEIWNVNFPGCALSDFKGILCDRKLARQEFYPDVYRPEFEEGGVLILSPAAGLYPGAEEDSDLEALVHGYISIGKIRNMIFGQDI